MSLATTGIVGTIVLVLMFFTGVPVSFSMMVVGLIGFSYLASTHAALQVLATEFFEIFANFNITVLPMFAFMGSIAFAAGISARLYDSGYTLFGQRRGGLAIASIIGCAGFAAICGSTAATAASMGTVALPEMKRYNYDDALATGSIAAGGTLGILIPPSTTLIIYGVLTEQSIGKLFIAGVLPGILLAILFIITISILCWRNPALAPAGAPAPLRQKLSGVMGIAETLVIFIFVMGGLFAGWFSPTQAGAAGAAGVLLLAIGRRTISWSGFIEALKETAVLTAFILPILAGGFVFGRFIAVTEIPFTIEAWITALAIPPWTVLALIILVHFIAGCFMDAFALIVLTIPIFFPVVLALGYDPIWYGIIIVLTTEMAAITPPVGLNVYVIKGVAKGVNLGTIFRGIVPFTVAVTVCTAILLAFPQIATFMPSFMRY